jgi:geranylgeranyl diphosphate synthase, type II
MDVSTRFEQSLREGMDAFLDPGTPAGLRDAIHHAVFPGGHRMRPRICLAVSHACGIEDLELAFAAAAGLELLHCASLVHDDMPCFDDAALRRGQPSVHAQFGAPLALLAGDALIVLAFQVLTRGASRYPQRLIRLLEIYGSSVGLPGGIVAGQAWECESKVDVVEYHRAKTGALFAAATMAGAAAAGEPHAAWGEMGERLGSAYQVADDLLDRFGDPAVIGKPVDRDRQCGRPNSVNAFGVDTATQRLQQLVHSVEDCVPECAGREALQSTVRIEAQRFVDLALGRRRAA